MQGRASGSRQQGGPAAKHESHDRAGKSPGAEHQGPQGMGMGFGAPELMEMAPDEFHMLGPRERQATILRMQGQVGNRATINRVFDTQLAPPAISPRNRSFAELIQDRDVGGIKNRRDYENATRGQRLQMVEILLDQTWVGPFDESAIEAIWNSFADSVIEVAGQNQDLWNRSIDRGAELNDIAAVRRIRSAFAADVKALAKVYMRQNRELVENEASRLGLGSLEEGAAPPAERSEEAEQALAEVQQLAREVQRADEVMRRLTAIPVGYDWIVYDGPGMSMRSKKMVATFSPRARPMVAPRPGEEGFANWEEVNEQYQAVVQAKSAIAARSPALFAAMEQGEAGNVAGATPQAAATALRGILGTTLENINTTDQALDEDDLDWRDLVPLHRQLYGGLPAKSGTPWNDPIYQSVASDVIGDYESTQFWIALGLGSLAAAAFIFSELATGGLATFLWASAGVALGATQAGISWERYDDLATAAGSAASEDTRLVSQGQVNAALFAAVLDTAFAFADVFSAARGVATAVRATAAREGIERVATLSGHEAKQAVERAVGELGPQETIRRSGMSATELAEIVGENTDAGRAIQEAAGDITVAPRSQPGEFTEVMATAESRRLAARLQGLFERWGSMTPVERLDELARQVNVDVQRSGMPVMEGVTRDARGAQMNSGAWEFVVDARLLEDNSITPEAFAGLVDSARHEVQHGMQWFRMIQLDVMRTGESAAEIARRRGVPEEVVEAAMEVQAGQRAGTRLAEGTALAREAELFFESVYGAASNARNAIYRELDAAEVAYKEASRNWDHVRGLSDVAEDSPLYQVAQRDLDAARTRFDQAYEAYRGLPEEVDAWRAGGQAGAAMRERLGLVGRLHEARQAERAAWDAYKPLEDLYIRVTSLPNHHLAYDRLLAYYQALDRWKRSLDAVQALEAALRRHARGAAVAP